MRQRHHRRKHDDARRLADHHLGAEQPERISGANAERAEPVAAPPRERDLGQPLARPAFRNAHHPTGKAGRQRGLVPALDPRLGEAIVVLDAVRGLEDLPDMGARVEDAVVGAHVAQAASRVDPGADADAHGEIDEKEEEIDPRAECRHHERGDAEEQTQAAAEQPHDAIS